MERTSGSFGSSLSMKFPLNPQRYTFPPAVAHLILVRSMRRATFFIAFLLGACVTPPPPQVTGRYAASLSMRDVQQISQLVAARPDLGRTIRKLQAVRRDRVH